VLDRTRFWRHSLEVAIASRNIAEKIGYRRLEEVFVGGLLHDIGMLILEHSFRDQFGELWKKAHKHTSMVELEETAWGTNHARVGQFLLEQWQLPEVICQCVGRHHNVFTVGADDPDLIPCQIVNLANMISQFPISDAPRLDYTPDAENRRIMCENIHLKSDALLAVEKHLFNQTIQESKYLEMDVGSTEEILVEANRMLFNQYAAVESLLEANRRMQQQAASDQVKRGFLESFKSTTSVLTTYTAQASASILKRAQQVLDGIRSGAIVDPSGSLTAAVLDIIENSQSVTSVMEEMRGLTSTETALYYDQESISAVEHRIREEMAPIEEPAATV
jgi:putative nucleotidyltransferase with HDIG domain